MMRSLIFATSAFLTTASMRALHSVKTISQVYKASTLITKSRPCFYTLKHISKNITTPSCIDYSSPLDENLGGFIERTLVSLKQSHHENSSHSGYITNIAGYHISRNNLCKLIYNWLHKIDGETTPLAIDGSFGNSCTSSITKEHPKTIYDISRQIMHCDTCRQNFFIYAQQLEAAKNKHVVPTNSTYCSDNH